MLHDVILVFLAAIRNQQNLQKKLPKYPLKPSYYSFNMAAVADQRLRQLKIKTGVVKRLAKEKTMYEKEVEDQEKKVEKMKAEHKDSHDVNKQIEVLEESKIMIPDCKRRLKTAYEDLKNLVSESEKDLDGSEEFKQAKTMLEETVLED